MENTDFLSTNTENDSSLNIDSIEHFLNKSKVFNGLFVFDNTLKASVVEQYLTAVTTFHDVSQYNAWEVISWYEENNINSRTKFEWNEDDTLQNRIDHIVVIARRPQLVHDFFRKWYRSNRYKVDSKVVIVFIPVVHQNLTLNAENNSLQNSISAIFKSAWLTYSYPLVLFNSDINNECSIYITDANPDTFNNCKPTRFKKLSINTILQDLKKFQKTRLRFLGCSLDVMALTLVPYVITKSGGDVEGIEATILTLIAERAHISVKFLKHNFTSWGHYYKNRTYTEMYDALYHRKCDIVMGNVPTIVNLQLDFTGSKVYLPTRLTFHVPKVGYLPAGMNMVTIFSPFGWSGLAFILILYIIVRYCFTFKTFQELRNVSVHDLKQDGGSLFLEGIAIVTARSTRHPVLLKNRVLFITFVIFSYVYTSSFENVLLSFIVQPISQYQLQTYDDLAKSQMTFAGTILSKEAYADNANKGDEAIREIYKRWHTIEIGDIELYLRQSEDYRDIIVNHNERSIAYLMKVEKKFIKDGIAQLRPIFPTFTFYSQLLMQKGHPFLNIFNVWLDRCTESGFLNHIESYYSQFKDDQKWSAFFPFHLENVSLTFFLYLVGICISTSVFFIEIFIKKIF